MPEKSHETSPGKKQVNIRLDLKTYERLRALAFQEGESPGAFLGRLVTELVTNAADRDPNIDKLVDISAEYQRDQMPPSENP